MVTMTVFALVVVPSTAIAPLPYVVPSTGCEIVSVGAWKTRNGTMMTTSRGVSASLPVSGLRAVIWNRLSPRRRSTWTLHSPLDWAVADELCPTRRADRHDRAGAGHALEAEGRVVLADLVHRRRRVRDRELGRLE